MERCGVLRKESKGRLYAEREGVFPVLDRVEMPFVMLVGWERGAGKRLVEMLSRSIRELCLRDDMADWVEYEWEPCDVVGQVKELLRLKEDMAPRLEAVEIERGDYEDDWREARMRRRKYSG